MQEAEAVMATKVKDEESSRETLLRSASELMVQQATHDVSLHAIARHAGVTAPLVKYHFGSREGLLLALIDRDTARPLQQLQELSAMALEPTTKLKIHITGIIRTYARLPYLNGLLNHMLRDTASDASETVKRTFIQPLIDAQRVIIEEGMASGVFRPVDPDELYFVIIGACQYLFSTRQAFREIMGGRPMKEEFAKGYGHAVVGIITAGIHA